MYNKEKWVMKTVEDYIVTIPDFPEPGIMFRDVTGVLDDAEGFRGATGALGTWYREKAALKES